MIRITNKANKIGNRLETWEVKIIVKYALDLKRIIDFIY